MITAVKSPGEYRLVWSKDPALKLPAEGEEEALRIARETQRWDLVDPKVQPTYFKMRWIPELPYRRWLDLGRGRGGPAGIEESLALLFLLALEDVENFGDIRIRKVEDDRLRDKRASDEILDKLKQALGREMASALVLELGLAVWQQEEKTAPK